MKIKKKTNKNNIQIFKCAMFLFIAMNFIACNNKYCSDIAEFIDGQYIESKERNVVDLGKLFSFDWDEIRVFKSFHTPTDISESLGFDCQCEAIYDGDNLFLFIKDNQVVKKEVGECRKLIFLDDKNGKLSISREQSSFVVKKQIEGNKEFYTLKNIK